MAIYNLKDTLTIQTAVAFSGATSGTVTLSAPAIAGTQSYTLPTTLPAAANYVLSCDTSGNLSWVSNAGGGSGTVTSVSVVSANGLGGTVATATTTPAITLTTSVGSALTPLPLVGNGTTISGMFNTQSVSGATISGSSIVLRDTYISTSTPNTITITAPTTVASSITYTWPTTAPTNRNILSSDTSGNLSWISNVANPVGTVAANYTSYASINVDDVFVGMAPTVASFGQNYTVDASDVAFGDMLFHQKYPLSGKTTFPPHFGIIQYDDQSVNGVVTPLYMGTVLSTNTAANIGATTPIIYTSTDGVNWTFKGSLPVVGRYASISARIIGTAPSQTRVWWIGNSTGANSYYSIDEGATWTTASATYTGSISAPPTSQTIDGISWFTAVNAIATTNIFKGSTTVASTYSAVNSATSFNLGSVIVAGAGTGATRTILALGSTVNYAISTDGGSTFTTGTLATTSCTAGVYDSVLSKYVVGSSPSLSGLTIQTSTTGATGTWTVATPTGTVPLSSGSTSMYSFAYVDSSGASTVGSYYQTTVAGTANPVLNFIVYSDDGGTSIKYKQVATSQPSIATPPLGSFSVTPEILFILVHGYNHLGFRKKYIYVDDNNGMSKAPLGTYQCLGKAGTQTGSYLWRRVS